MKLQSTYHEQDDFEARFVVLKAVTPIGQLLVSLGVGTIVGRAVSVTEVGAEAYRRLVLLGGSERATLHLATVPNRAKAGEILQKSILAAREGDSLFIVCKNPEVYDRVYQLLNVDHG